MTPDRIGFDRTLRFPWLDQAALLAGELRDEEALRVALLEWLAGHVKGSESRRRTVDVLTRLWWRVPKAHIPLRDEALGWIAGLPARERLALHWGMALLAYPFFQDVVGTAGRLMRLQGTFKLAQLEQRIAARWGNRATLEYALARVVRSLQDWGVVLSGEQRGIYMPPRAAIPLPTAVALWLLEAVLQARGPGLPAGDLLRAPELFPFESAVALGALAGSPRFTLQQEGPEFTVTQRSRQGGKPSQ